MGTLNASTLNVSTLNVSNYDLNPAVEIDGYENELFCGYEGIVKQIAKELESKDGKGVIVCDFYPGVDKNEVINGLKPLSPTLVIDADECGFNGAELEEKLSDYLTEDRVFGIMCKKQLEDLFDKDKLNEARKKVEAAKNRNETVLVVGTGASFITYGDIYLYFDLARWEIQLRYRNGMSNRNIENSDAPILTKYKRGFFVEWRLVDNYKKRRFERFDYIVDTNKKNEPKMLSGKAFLAALDDVSQRPFRTQPYFDPGVWGGQWMKEKFGLDKSKKNFAWSFDGVPEENSLNLKIGETVLEFPCIDLVLYRPHQLLGERVHGRFGAEFPIRFDLLDTMGGENLSLQVHPLTEYIQEKFGMNYTQDESYYILDCEKGEDGDEPCVYLGVKKNVDKQAMAEALREAEKGVSPFPAEEYVNKIPVKKHDHVLIPAGTVHCSGSNTMVLEISATPYIFTFKLWDWGRIGFDGLPRPIHIEHGLENIQWDRDTDWVNENIMHQEKLCFDRLSSDGTKLERTGLHSREFIDTFRYTLTKPINVKTNDSVHVLNLVEGESAVIESPTNAFKPFEVHYAETFIIPASVNEYIINPKFDEKSGSKAPISVIAAWVR